MTDQDDKMIEKKRQAVRSILGLYGSIARHYCPADSVVDAGVAILDELILSAAPSSDLVELLRKYEWVFDTSGIEFCPECECSKKHGHSQDCALRSALSGVTEKGVSDGR